MTDVRKMRLLFHTVRLKVTPRLAVKRHRQSISLAAIIGALRRLSMGVQFALPSSGAK